MLVDGLMRTPEQFTEPEVIELGEKGAHEGEEEDEDE